MSFERGRHHTGRIRHDVDAVVIGTGAGGGMACLELARAGARVLALEEGPLLTQEDMVQREDVMFPLLYQERGERMTADYAIRVMGGRCIGGSTVHNTNLCKRAPDAILEAWERQHAVSGLRASDLAPIYDSVERELSVSAIPPELRNENNRILERGVARLGLRGGGLRHNRVGCTGSGFCELGCPFNAKQNSAKVLLPEASGLGAQIWSDAHVTRIVHDRSRVQGVEAQLLGADGAPRGELVVRAPLVVLAGSAIGSAAVGVNSNLPDPYGRLGHGLRLHPGTVIVGLFEQRVEGWKGIPQSYECTEFLDFREGSQRRVWITTAFAHPVGASVMLPGFGGDHRAWMLQYPYVAALTAMVHDEGEGRVSLRSDGRPHIHYELGERDRQQLVLGATACARILLAAGARRVLVPSVPALVIERESELDRIGAVLRPGSAPLSSVHPMGSMALGDDPRRAVVQSSGEHHQLQGLFVLDGSLFPTSLGVPPQLTIYTLARHLARHVIERLRRTA